jgi:hypothetical protein
MPPSFFIWHQGEADAISYTSKDVYKRDLAAVIDSFVGPNRTPWIMLQASACMTMPQGSLPILQAQSEVARAGKGILIAFSTDELDRHFRYDGCHFNERGKRVILDRLLRFLHESGVASAAQGQ